MTAIVELMRLRLGDQRGQASVELLAMVPIAVALALATGQLLAAGAARQAAGAGAQAAAMSLIQGGDPARAARAAVPAWARGSLRVTLRGREVEVRVQPRSPLPTLTPLASALTAKERASAGPGP